MKNILTILLFTISVSSGAQGLEKSVNELIDKKIDTFSRKLDSSIVITASTSNATPIYLDTLYAPLNKSMVYELTLTAHNDGNADMGSSVKTIVIKNTNGVYSIARNVTPLAYLGQGTLSKAVWAVSMVNGLPVIVLTGILNTSISWTVSKRNQ
jgi:hypothetical protein